MIILNAGFGEERESFHKLPKFKGKKASPYQEEEEEEKGKI